MRPYLIGIAALVVLGLITMFLIFPGLNGPVLPIGFVIIIGGSFALYAIGAKKINAYKDRFKQKIISTIVSSISPDISFQSNAHISENEFNQSSLFGRYNRYHGEDLLAGKYDKTNFRLSELKVKKVEGHGKDRKERKIFWRSVYDCRFQQKLFRNNLCVSGLCRRTDGAMALVQHFKNFHPKENWFIWKTPHLKNCSRFLVQTRFEARYLLTVNMLRNITRMKKKFDKPMYMAFKNNNLYTAISTTNNYFESSSDTSALDREMFRRLYQEVQLCLSIIDELNLNRRLWSKQ